MSARIYGLRASRRVPDYSRRATTGNIMRDSRYGEVNWEARRAKSKRRWNKIERRIDRKAKRLPNANQLGMHYAEIRDLLAYKAEAMKERAEFLNFIGMDDAAAVVISAMEAMANGLVNLYIDAMYDFWTQGAGRFNHGQIAIYLRVYREVMDLHAVSALEEWPYVDPYMYVEEIQYSYNYDVWERAFSDITEAPLHHMEAFRDLAIYIQDMIGNMGGVVSIAGTMRDALGSLTAGAGMKAVRQLSDGEKASGAFNYGGIEIF